MPATDVRSERGTHATPPRFLDNELFDELTGRLGLTTETDRAALVGIDRTTLWRFRRRQFTPSLDVAMKMAKTLETTVERLFGAAS